MFASSTEIITVSVEWKISNIYVKYPGGSCSFGCSKLDPCGYSNYTTPIAKFSDTNVVRLKLGKIAGDASESWVGEIKEIKFETRMYNRTYFSVMDFGFLCLAPSDAPTGSPTNQPTL